MCVFGWYYESDCLTSLVLPQQVKTGGYLGLSRPWLRWTGGKNLWLWLSEVQIEPQHGGERDCTSGAAAGAPPPDCHQSSPARLLEQNCWTGMGKWMVIVRKAHQPLQQIVKRLSEIPYIEAPHPKKRTNITQNPHWWSFTLPVHILSTVQEGFH